MTVKVIRGAALWMAEIVDPRLDRSKRENLMKKTLFLVGHSNTLWLNCQSDF